ncbi:MAG: hypothetical protein A2408_00105 [Candidatus Yonathbacteria bacterium RIFOXYC1_FULL_52_10]|uniref:Fibronectin type-III domain-containing protein n=1 Tax=Candidatus Yonathbacteria bacterium RIFOXYD1_FULL_52_36 TaxID=1802730 RepID=A0A1G2SK88_9BACT|nr:MAG: hypothetical protein A2408_00105 [Candidatus Yonathbacteria bacterium RIFOXYC1_FULL_52_10]OHA85485.1 MAG: hypothetical protein A2591_01355 [Candidatus Yonathbacteria bacterium RIFOXYD1_FULL_52_36]
MLKQIATGAVITGLALGMIAPSLAMAQTGTGTSTSTTTHTETLRAQIVALQARIAELQAQILEIRKQQTQLVLEIATTTNVGAQGDNVKLLQLYLAQDPTLYPEGLITGYFGTKTLKALERYEAKYSDDDGDDDGDDDDNDGKKNNGKGKAKGKDKQRENALEKINKSLRNGSWVVVKSATDPNTCIVTPPGHFVAPGYAKNFGKPISIPCKDLPPGIQRLMNGTVTPPVADTTAPTFSQVNVGTLTATTAIITATTSEQTTVRAQYGTTTAYGSTTAFGTLGTTTTLTLSGLTPSTTYHYVLHARDAAGNTATTTDAVFTTATTPDTTAPVISGAAATSTTATGSSIAWTTNEPASSKLYYGTTTPLVLGTALTSFDPTFLTNHLVAVSGLTASTTYRYVIESKDASGNTATSTENSFVTLP